MFPVVVLDFLHKSPTSSSSTSQPNFKPLLSNSYVLNPYKRPSFEKKPQNATSQTFIVRTLPHLRHHSVSSLNTFFAKDNSKEYPASSETLETKESLLNLSDTFQYQCEGLLEESESFSQPLPRLRRKSDVSYWSGGQSGLEKRIGNLIYEPQRIENKKTPPTPSNSNGNLCSKVRRAFKKAVAVQEMTKVGVKREIKPICSPKDLRELRQKRTSFINMESILSKGETSREQVKDHGEASSASRKVKVLKLTGVKDNRRTEALEKLTHPISEGRETKVMSPNGFKENKIFKELQVDTTMKKRKKSPKKKKPIRDIKNNSPFNSGNKSALPRHRPAESLGSLKSPSSAQTFKLSLEGSQNLFDTEILNSREDTIDDDAETIEMLNSMGKDLLPAIEEEKVQIRKKKKVHTVENIIKNISKKHHAVQSLGYLPSLRISDRRATQQPTSLESWDNRMYQTGEISVLKKQMKESPRNVRRLFKPQVRTAKDILTTYSHI